MPHDPTDAVAVVHVVVPVHDEADLLAATLDSVSAALDHVRSARPALTARLTVVLDACTDDSGVVCAVRDVDVVTTAARNVGGARAAGTARAARLAAADAVAPAATWIACTDGDSRVPADWLTDQLEVAEAGADVVLGRVEPDDTAADAVVAAWHALHDDGRVGVHGAHLGFRLSSYDAAGGWAHLADREDLDLYQRLLATGARYGAATRPVLTSSRLQGRVSGGFAAFLTALDRPAS